LIIFSLLALSNSARAETSFWEEMATPGITEYRTYVTEARELIDRGEHEQALAALRRARELLPDQALADAWAGYALTLLGRYDEAVAAWERVLSLEPALLDEEVLAFECTIALARVGRYQQASEIYNQMLVLGVSAQRRSLVLVNLAEMLVAASCDGLDDAIDLYHEAVREDPDRAGAQWGLGAALSRAGRDEEARVALATAVRLDPQWTTFTREGSFFVPPYDIHFYRALGWEQLGNRDQALLEWQTYLDSGGAEGCWSEVARSHQRELGRRSGAASRRPR
jgi:tetratricopeptide (TPR) repeat protein